MNCSVCGEPALNGLIFCSEHRDQWLTWTWKKVKQNTTKTREELVKEFVEEKRC